MHYAGTEDIVVFVVVLLLVGLGQLGKFLLKLWNQAQEDTRATPSDGRQSNYDLWQPEQQHQHPAVPPPVPAKAGQMRRSEVSEVSREAARAVAALERMDDSFERSQDSAYDYEHSGMLEEADDEFGTDRRHAASRKRKLKVNMRTHRKLRQAVVTREILDRPRCFDI